MRVILVLFTFLISISAWSGTIVENFDDGNYDGWKIVGGGSWNRNVQDKFSIENGVLRINAINKPEINYFLTMINDWKDYSFSADIKILDTQAGGFE